MIIASNVSKKYDNKHIIKKFNYKFEKGLYVIVGKSGVGKTTLLNILALNDKKIGGFISVVGGILYLKDKNNLVSNLTVKEHIKLFEKIEKKKINTIFNIKGMMNKKIKKLSLGERQLLALTIALNSNQENIILDEPFSALSKENLKKACMFIEGESNKKTIIITTHNEEFLSSYKRLDLNERAGNKEIYKVDENLENNKKELKFKFLTTYFRKTLIKKIFFFCSLASSVISFVLVNNYLESNFNEYLSYFKVSEGHIISHKKTVEELNENIFYEIIKKLSLYVEDYNASYYNYSLYKLDLKTDEYYIDNAFVLSSIKYIEENLGENEIVLGINYRDFCANNALFSCDKEYVKTLLINKSIKEFPYVIKSVFDNEETVILCNERFVKLYDSNEYEEYYFDIKKENKENIFKIINKDDFLNNFEFILKGENENDLRYKVEIKDYKYFNTINYDDYIVCLDKGYDCFNYLNNFESLIKIGDFYEIEGIDLKIINEDLNDNEIVISSFLSEKINKKEGDEVCLYFRYENEIKEVVFYIKSVIYSEECIIYQNSEWSINLFKDILNYKESDLRIKNILIYEEVKKEDYENDDLYKEMLLSFKKSLIKIKKIIYIFNLFVSSVSVSILILLEIFQNKFKKEYFRYLKLLNVEIKKEP